MPVRVRPNCTTCRALAGGYDWQTHEATIGAIPWHSDDVAGIDADHLRNSGEHQASRRREAAR
jgi:hypothetical protein